MIDELPEWYPFANAPGREIDGWLAAAEPPYAAMRAALPWLDRAAEFDAWLAGMRSARSSPCEARGIAQALPGIARIPLPPRRLQGQGA